MEYREEEGMSEAVRKGPPGVPEQHGGPEAAERRADRSPASGPLGGVRRHPPSRAATVDAAVDQMFPPQPEHSPPLPQQITPLTPERAEAPDENMLSGLRSYTQTPPEGRWSGEPTATDRYAMMRTRQGQNALATAAGQPLLFRPSVSMNVDVDGESYKVEVSEDGTFISGPGLLTGGTGIDADKLAVVLARIKHQVGLPDCPLDQWAKNQLSLLTGDNPQPIPPKEVEVAERAAQSQIFSLAQQLEERLPTRGEGLTQLVRQLRTANETDVVYREIFSSSSSPQEYNEGVYGESIPIREYVVGSVRNSVAGLRERNAGRAVMERVAISMDASAEIPLEEIGGEDFRDSSELVGRPGTPSLGEKDKALGFSRTREASSFRELWYVDGAVVADETIDIIETRKRAEAGVKKALKELEGRTDPEANARRSALQKMLRTLDRDQSFLHATGLREMVEEVTDPHRPAGAPTIDDIAFAEPPDLVKDSVVSKETGKAFDIIRVGAFSDHLNSVVSLKLLQKAANEPPDGPARKEIKEIRDRLEERLRTEKLTDQQRAVLKHMIGQLDPLKLSQTLIERKEILRQQALQLVMTQVGEAGSRLNGMEKLHVAHTSLLYPGKESWDKSGIGHVEQRMIEDMEEIFSEFNGKEILLDAGLEGPYVDVNGAIHIPRPRGVDRTSVPLATHYVNLSATHKLTEEQAAGQRELAENTIRELETEINRQTDPILKQQEAAEQELKRAKGTGDRRQILRAQKGVQAAEEKVSDLLRARKLLAEVRGTLNGTTTFHTAAKLLEVQEIVGWYASTGCYSDKDRGGLTGRTVLTNRVAHSMQNESGALEGQIALAEEDERTGEAASLGERAHLLQARARKLMDENPYAAFAPDSCQMRVIQHVVKRPQRFLKAWLGMRKAATIAKVCLPLFARARWGELREAARRAEHEVVARSRLRVRRLVPQPSQEVELM